MLILADTVVILRLMDRRDPQHAVIRQAVRLLIQRGDELVTSTQNITEFWNVCTRPATVRGGLGLDISESDRRLRILARIVDILADHPATFSIWRQLIVSHSVQGKQVHDARIAAQMQAHGISSILTLNGSDFLRYTTITVIDPVSLIVASSSTAP